MTMVVADVSSVNVMEALGVASRAPEISNTATPSTGGHIESHSVIRVVKSLFLSNPPNWVWSALRGVLKSLIAKAGLFCLSDPPPLKLNERELLVMKFTLPPLLTLQLGQFWIRQGVHALKR
jgi:hypothetical protein